MPAGRRIREERRFRGLTQRHYRALIRNERQKLIVIDGEPGDRFGSAADIDQNLLVIGAANANERWRAAWRAS